jgi:uncharacterized protein YjbJ (UPF0337 family)
MTWYRMAGHWKTFAVMVKAKWGKQLAGLLQRRYGYARDQAEREINEFSNEPE